VIENTPIVVTRIAPRNAAGVSAKIKPCALSVHTIKKLRHPIYPLVKDLFHLAADGMAFTKQSRSQQGEAI
jgi:hypothetical protein